MGVFPTDIPIDAIGSDNDKWLFQLREPLDGHHVHTLLERGRSVEPVTGRIMRRIAGGMEVIGAMRAAGDMLELGDCSTLKPTTLLNVEPEDTQPAAPTTGDAPVEVVDPEAAELAQLEADIAALDAANASTPAAAPASGGVPDSGAAVPSTADTQPATQKSKGKK